MDNFVTRNIAILFMLWFKFILGLSFIFPIVFGYGAVDNEFETMENKINLNQE